jgi:hypothetical protein
METKEKIKFTLAFILAGWVMLLCMPRLPEESPASTTQIAIYAAINFAVMIKVSKWIRQIN